MKQFDKYSHAYNAIRGKVAYPDALYNMLAKRVPGRDAALDIGCGNGISTIRLAPYYDYVEGADIGASLIEKARESYPNITFTVSSAEDYQTHRKFNLITSATSFYWMNRDVVLGKMENLLQPDGIFCAYKYDFPIVYGPLRELIERELVLLWSAHRDPRLTRYDDTLERIQASRSFSLCERTVLPNIIDITPLEVGLFFLSTSYATRYIDQAGGVEYADDFLRRITEADSSATAKVNFDIHVFLAQR
jgi:ubiquinone/menaquinone biosynthesis C-methylase UbiE